MLALHSRLGRCSLATSQPDLSGLETDSAEVRAIFDLYLSDLERKGSTCLQTLERLELFTAILNSHLIDKSADLSLEEGLRICDLRSSTPIPLQCLSSGEKHLILLFYSLIFESNKDGLCLIDEPEISLNVDWQRRFVANVLEAASLTPQQFVVATHSPVVVDQHCDLLRPIIIE